MGKRSTLTCLIMLLLASCSTSNNEEYLLGEWYNESIKVDINALNGSADSVFTVPVGQWEQILQIKPINTNFKPDGTYESIYYNLDGSELQRSAGEWELKRDSLFLTSMGETTAYYFQWQEGKASFEGYLDWDMDGNADDFYSGVQIKR